MPNTPPIATVAGQSVALHVTGYPDVPNRWGSGHIRVASIRLDYGSSVSPDARHVFVVGAWVRDDGEVTDDPVDRYYAAPDGDMSDWPDWIADLTRTHTPSASVDRAAVLREAAATVAALDRRKLGIAADTIRDAWEEGRDAGADELRRMAAEAQQQEFGSGCAHCVCCHAWGDREAHAALVRDDGAEAQQQPDTETPAGANTPLICSNERHATKAAALEQEVKHVRDVCDQLRRASALADGEPHTDRERGIVQAVTRVLSALKAEHTPEEA